ncbi:MAG: hypothetical protein NVSMB25_07600 [Thermoleophilaceae bacterium]
MGRAGTALQSALAIGAVLAAGALSSPLAQAAPVLAAAGDIACPPDRMPVPGTECQQDATHRLIQGAAPAAVAALGDTQYNSATLTEYYSPGAFNDTWGQLTAPIHPAPGNHEYQTAGAPDYFTYFGARAGDPKTGYYSYDLPGWHIISLNSNCTDSGCGSMLAGAVPATEVAWLRTDLAAHPGVCTLAYWHHPLFTGSSGSRSPGVRPLWEALYAARADVVLDGHAHSYERFAQQDPSGVATSDGVREFVVGTGGEDLRAFDSSPPNREAADSGHFGVLFLTLSPGSYEWRFRGAPGGALIDQGGPTACHAQAPTAAVPPPPGPRSTHDPGAGSADLRLPFLGITLGPPKVRVARDGAVHVEIGCPARSQGNCVGIDTLSLNGRVRVRRGLPARRQRPTALGSQRFSISPGTTRAITIRLSRRARRMLAKRRSLTASQTAITHDSRGISTRTYAALRISLDVRTRARRRR